MTWAWHGETGIVCLMVVVVGAVMVGFGSSVVVSHVVVVEVSNGFDFQWVLM